MPKFYLLVLFLAFYGQGAFSQNDFIPGFVQIKENDTLFGLINHKTDKSNTQICHFKYSESDSVQKFYPENIYGYRFLNNKYYVSRSIDTPDSSKTIFVEYLVNGTIDLFFFRDNLGDHYLLQAKDSPLKEISFMDEIVYVEDKPYAREYMVNRGLTRYFMNDCPELFDDIDEIKIPTHISLIGLFKDYHDKTCPNEVCIIYEKKLPPFRVDLQMVVGLIKVNKEITMDNYYNSDYSIMYGVHAFLGMPLTNERLFFKSGVVTSQVNELVERKIGGVYNTFKNYTYINIPLQFQYIFLKKRINPTFGAGLNLLISHHTPFLFLPTANMGVNAKINQLFYVSFYSDINYTGKHFIFPDRNTELVFHSFSIGLSIKL